MSKPLPPPFYLGFLPNAASPTGAILYAAIAGLLVTAIGWCVKHMRARRPQRVPHRDDAGAVADFATGLHQAFMAVRDAVEYFDKYPVLVNPDTWSLSSGTDELGEASRTLAEAEARLPRVVLVLGKRADSGSTSIGKLRATMDSLHCYVDQHRDTHGDWSIDDLEAAKLSLKIARRAEQEFLEKARAMG